eukprot:CAMPEP_0194142320 /NCGR_PEP_ID=MMETSP0152-20130528/11611_1 /TAXON_ID=1049557 /ORGANISM="Thalassiothrix antarctica, Strain L6-D1" /LENGTH=216 /DNA_ID=CAMNT_0038841239 /DNA_START=128 /DNA_END=778 /DNA_ORIENTATION=-
MNKDNNSIDPRKNSGMSNSAVSVRSNIFHQLISEIGTINREIHTTVMPCHRHVNIPMIIQVIPVGESNASFTNIDNKIIIKTNDTDAILITSDIGVMALMLLGNHLHPFFHPPLTSAFIMTIMDHQRIIMIILEVGVLNIQVIINPIIINGSCQAERDQNLRVVRKERSAEKNAENHRMRLKKGGQEVKVQKQKKNPRKLKLSRKNLMKRTGEIVT